MHAHSCAWTSAHMHAHAHAHTHTSAKAHTQAFHINTNNLRTHTLHKECLWDQQALLTKLQLIIVRKYYSAHTHLQGHCTHTRTWTHACTQVYMHMNTSTCTSVTSTLIHLRGCCQLSQWQLNVRVQVGVFVCDELTCKNKHKQTEHKHMHTHSHERSSSTGPAVQFTGKLSASNFNSFWSRLSAPKLSSVLGGGFHE